MPRPTTCFYISRLISCPAGNRWLYQRFPPQWSTQQRCGSLSSVVTIYVFLLLSLWTKKKRLGLWKCPIIFKFMLLLCIVFVSLILAWSDTHIHHHTVHPEAGCDVFNARDASVLRVTTRPIVFVRVSICSFFLLHQWTGITVTDRCDRWLPRTQTYTRGFTVVTAIFPWICHVRIAMATVMA